MTIFSDNPHDRRIERFMTAIPNFKPRGVGVRFSESQILITVTAATPTEILTATMRQIRCPPFRKRFDEYIESEENPMTYINEKHRARFELAAKNIVKTNYARPTDYRMRSGGIKRENQGGLYRRHGNRDDAVNSLENRNGVM